MKQFYYGNNFFEHGYQVLKKSDGISGSAEKLMEKLAPPFSSLAVGESEIGLYITSRECVFFQNTNNAPDVNSGINRPTFFSHQYYADLFEVGDVMREADKLIGGMRFESEFSDLTCDISEAYPSRNEFWNANVSDNFIASLAKMRKTGGKLIVYGNALNCTEVRKFMAGAAASGNVGSFVMAGKANDKRLEMFDIIFCSTKNIMSFKGMFFTNCIYYDYDTDTAIDTDMPADGGFYTEEKARRNPDEDMHINITDETEDLELKSEVRKLKLITVMILLLTVISLMLNLLMFTSIRSEKKTYRDVPVDIKQESQIKTEKSVGADEEAKDSKGKQEKKEAEEKRADEEDEASDKKEDKKSDEKAETSDKKSDENSEEDTL